MLTGNCLVGEPGVGKSTILKHYAYLCGQELLECSPHTLPGGPSPSAQLLSRFRVALSSGSWLLLRRIDHMGEQDLALIAECISMVSEGLQQQVARVALNGLQLPLNRNARVFMTIETLGGSEMPARMV